MLTVQTQATQNNKLCFKTASGAFIRTGCIILVNQAHCVMIEEKGSLTFPGGRCEQIDSDIFDTSLREFYEEVILNGMHSQADYLYNWKEILHDILKNPADQDDAVITYIHDQIKSSSYFLSPGKLKTCYFLISCTPALMQKIKTTGVHIVPISKFYNTIALRYGTFSLRNREKSFRKKLSRFMRNAILFSETAGISDHICSESKSEKSAAIRVKK